MNTLDIDRTMRAIAHTFSVASQLFHTLVCYSRIQADSPVAKARSPFESVFSYRA